MAKKNLKTKTGKMPFKTAAMPAAAMENTLPSPKVMPKKAAPMQPDHPRIKQAKAIGSNMTKAMAGRK